MKLSEKIKSFKSLLSSEPNLAGFITLFSFGTVARAVQFLVPLLIYTLLPSSKELDFYFYWCTQSNLIASFLSAIWPTALTSLIVKIRAQQGEITALQISSVMLKRFFIFVTLVAVVVALLANSHLLGGPLSTNLDHSLILWGLVITIVTTSMAVAISEIANAQRKFGILYQGLLSSAVVQILVLVLCSARYVLELSFLLGCCAQILICIYLLREQLSSYINLRRENLPSLTLNVQELLESAPQKKTILLLYLGGIFTLLASHLSFRLLGNDQIGAVSAFAMASMLALAPQQLFVQHLSTIAGVAMTESFHKSPQDFARVSKNWRNRLFLLSLFLGFTVAICSLTALIILPYFSSIKDSWSLVVSMMLFLSLPLAVSGLITWLTRVAVSVEKINAAIWNQIVANSFTILVLFLCSNNQVLFSTPLALAIAALFQLISIPMFIGFFKL